MFRFLLAAGLLVRLCAAQQSGWQAGQVNSTMCYWDSPRAAVVRDTLYIDGGALWWRPGMSDGSYGIPTSDDNPLGIVYQLNFSSVFNTTAQTNFSNVFTTQSKAAAGGAANNVAPNYYDGVMIANDFEWFIYGGLITLTAGYSLPGSQSAAAYEVYASGPPKQFQAGYIIEQLPDSVTRYVTNGAGVSIPSENLGYYFGGLRSTSFGPIYYQAGNESDNADVLSTTMIELNLNVQRAEVWTNLTLPTTVPGRINAELVWVPVSKGGVLVAIGGVVDAEYAEYTTSLNATQVAETNLKSPLLMSTVSVYDIDAGTWYQQPTSETPPPMLTQGCTVMASAQDGSSHNIYWYGGWAGIDNTQPFSDDVWVLSIPTFTWMKVSSGTPSHARAGHRCVKPYPDQMFVIGGYAPLTGLVPKCLDGNIVQIFNLSSATWITDYNPEVWSNYSVPSMIASIIGGSGTGSATQSVPSPSGFANASLGAVFASAYNTSKITNWYPYAAATSTSPPSNTTSISPVPKPGSGTPSYLGPVLGVVLGLFFLTLLIVAFLIWRRRHLFRSSAAGGQSENGTLDNRRWVANWLRSTPVDAKAPTVTTDEPSSPYDADERQEMAEVQGQEVYEMMDTSRLNELSSNPSDTGTGLHPIPLTTQIPSPHIRPRNLAHASSVTSATSNASSSYTQFSEVRPSVSPVMWEGAATGREGTISGMSQMSENDRGHLRGISETSVSTVGGSPHHPTNTSNSTATGTGTGATNEGISEGNSERAGEIPPAVPDPPTRSAAVSPLTPGQKIGEESNDYLAAKLENDEKENDKLTPGTPASSKRRSNFSEELGEK